VLRRAAHIPNQLNAGSRSRRPRIYCRALSPFRDCSSDHPRQKTKSEAQVSLVITGIDDKAWTTYCIDDTYFEEDKDMAFLEANHNTFMDPVLFCFTSLDKPIWSPREFFACP
jgi:hypothetical protein